MIYSLEQIKEIVEPIAQSVAQKYKLNALWVFGSYARNEATDESDLDFLIDYTDTSIFNYFDYFDLEQELEQLFNKKIDLITTYALYDHTMGKYSIRFMNFVINDRVIIYEKI
jgi:predicted nucleotidyltransferase